MSAPRATTILAAIVALGLLTVLGCGAPGANPARAVAAPADSKLVFAHYFPPYPISIDNQPADRDYYTTNYLTPTGASAAFGGLLRDRPLPRPPRAAADWRGQDLADEVRQAVSAGIDGFTLDLLTTDDSPQWIASVPALLTRAAHAVDPAFRIMLMPDMNGELGNLGPDALADQIARLAALPSVYHLADGRLVVSPFLAENHPVTWWAQFLARMRADHGIDVALVPLFANGIDHGDYSAVSYGYSTWGGRNPAFNPTSGYPVRDIAAAHRAGKVWMQPVSVQDYRPGEHVFDEAENTTNLRNTWQIAMSGGSDWVQLVTWNDYSEGTAFAPSAHHGRAFLDICAYYIRMFKTGVAPAVGADQLYLTHRGQLAAAQPILPESSPMTLRPGSSPVRDAAEAFTLLTAPAVVTITIAGASRSCAVPAGPGVCTMPMDPAQPDNAAVSAVVARAGRTVSVARSPWPVLRNPPVQDVEYTATAGTGGA